MCVNLDDGGFECRCLEGYEGNGRQCRGIHILLLRVLYHMVINDIKLPHSLDIDECARNRDNCDSNANCVNTQGSFECVCREGYEGNGRMCTGI